MLTPPPTSVDQMARHAHAAASNRPPLPLPPHGSLQPAAAAPLAPPRPLEPAPLRGGRCDRFSSPPELRGATSLPVLRYLLGRGSGDPSMLDARGFTPLHNAAEYGHDEAVRLLLANGVPVDPLNYRGTPPHMAAAMDQDQALKILLDHGADPNRVLHHVLSPFMSAYCARSLKCRKLLVEAGADVNFNNPCGKPVLMMAVDNGMTGIVKYLLEVGADPNIHDRESVEKQIADAKSRGKEAFAKGAALMRPTTMCWYMLGSKFRVHLLGCCCRQWRKTRLKPPYSPTEAYAGCV
ncbi:hypothetical protein GQ55_3G462300 [Panicum hallii var. hallii]|uniref:Uncharacterized protein n=1 Tax=Panicum hallii var. hallii TaxID=1504633 RepID=A0A2T7EIX9_9POAL|nr:hypothetical protein GQ55_3G462300 [Panicum hallii var. hallii]